MAAYLRADAQEISSENTIEQLLISRIPIIQYMQLYQEQTLEQEDESTAQRILQLEGMDESVRDIDEESLDYGEDALHIENSMLIEMERENGLHNNVAGETTGEEAGDEKVLTFSPSSYPSYSYDWSEEWDYEKLVSNFYAVDKSTQLAQKYMKLHSLLECDLSVDKSIEGPQILIYHTHSLEAFQDSKPGDTSTSIIGAGAKLARLLEEEYGFKVYHHQEEFDTEHSEAYAAALPKLEKILEENPTIEVVIDLHRDAMTGDRRLVMDLQGRPTARFMFFNGLSYTKGNGEISYLENPYIQDNLALSFQAQVAANEYYPGIARKIYLKAYRYNMHLKPKSMLIELGAQNNTVEEIMNACDPLAHILAIVFDEML